MGRNVAIGIQNFDKIIENNYFYVDKTSFIKEWWDSGDSVTLIARPRRFGKTLNMSMLEQFFSLKYADGGNLFEGLDIWKEEKYRKLQGTYPVISLSFANIKETNYISTRKNICQMLAGLYGEYTFLLKSDTMEEVDKEYFRRVSYQMDDVDAAITLHNLSKYLYRYYGKKVIILLDEYDTPMQEAYVNGYWEELVALTRSLFNSTFKTNPWLERGIMTGITRVSTPQASLGKESIFSDLNNLEVVTTTSDKYATSFGFTEEEVFAALEECDLSEEKEEVKRWYDGFIFGKHEDIYNPWSILNFIDKRDYKTYWAPEDYHLQVVGSRQMSASSHLARCLHENTSANSLVGKLIREGSKRVKGTFEALLQGEVIKCPIDEQIVYNQLDKNESAIWSLLLASGYLKVISYERLEMLPSGREPLYELALTNNEVMWMFHSMVRRWFAEAETDYNDFISALLLNDLDAMNI